MSKTYEHVVDWSLKQFTAKDFVERYAKDLLNRNAAICDLGCGRGDSYDYFHKIFSHSRWIGVDIEDSPEVNSRTRQDIEFISYNGIDIPIASATMDLVYSHQVFEHVRHPEALLYDIFRCIKPGGLFIGSVSYLEPYHSFSIQNFTPYGWIVLLQSCGFTDIALGGGIDGINMIRRMDDIKSFNGSFWDLSDNNAKILGQSKLSVKQRNYQVLLRSAHIVFKACKPKSIGVST